MKWRGSFFGAAVICFAARPEEREGRWRASLDAPTGRSDGCSQIKEQKSESDREAEQQAQCVDPNSFWYFTRVAAHAHLVTPYLARRRCISPAPNRTAGEEAPPQNTDIPRHAIDDLSMMKRRSYSAQRCHSQTRPSSR